jgi:hypothetical protein
MLQESSKSSGITCREGADMKAHSAAMIVAAFVLALGSATYGAQPPDVVSSDANTNTAMGTGALFNLTTGSQNTAAGWQTLYYTTSGYQNTAVGVNALLVNTVGYQNTAVGGFALSSNTTGFINSAFGSGALASNTTGSSNHAFGINALGQNTSGNDNSALGTSVLSSNTTGNTNSALGNYALAENTTGSENTASGVSALSSNTTGSHNTASGVGALSLNTTGSGNIALGDNAGYNLTIGSNNIDIGNLGLAGESGTIRIGAAGQHTKTLIAGIWGNQVRRGASVVVNSSGQLGVEESSERYKTDIASMDLNSTKTLQLRPVTYRLKTDPAGELQYGLIAEEVEQVFPELVVRDDAGQIEGVRYDRLAPILLNEVQQQQQKLAAQEEKLAAQARELGDLEQQFAQLQELNRAMQAALTKLQAMDLSVALR